MRIIVVATTPFSSGRGSHIRILQEAIALTKQGHYLEIITYPLGSNPKECSEYNIKISRISNILPWYSKSSAGPSSGKVLFDAVLFFKVLFRVFLEKPDIIYAHNHEAVIISFLIQKIIFWRRIKTTGDFQGSLVSEMIIYKNIKSKIIKIFFRTVEKMTHRMPDHAIASSRPLAQYISKDRKKSCIVFYDAPSISFVLRDKKNMRKKYDIPEDAFVILYAGGFTRDKGIESLLALIQATAGRNILWILAGGPREEMQLSLEISSQVRIISPLDTIVLEELLCLADCAIDPKERGSLQASGKIINYMQYGLPVFCFDDMVSRDYLGDVLADKLSGGNLVDLQGRILYFMSHREECLIMLEDIRKRAALFSWDSIKGNI